MTCNSEEQLPTKLLTAWCNNKFRVGGVLHSNKKTIGQNIALDVPIVDIFGSLKSWSHLALDDKYWKYLINGLRNASTPPLGSPSSPTAEITKPLSTPSTPHPSQLPPTSPQPRHSKIPSLPNP